MSEEDAKLLMKINSSRNEKMKNFFFLASLAWLTIQQSDKTTINNEKIQWKEPFGNVWVKKFLCQRFI